MKSIGKKKNRIVLLILVIALFSAFIIVQGIDPTPTLLIQSNEKAWVVTKHTGIESDFELHFLNSKNKSTRICFTPRTGVDIAGNTGDRLLRDANNNPILDAQNKEISLKYETAKCDINGTKFDGYTVDLSNAQMVNVGDYVKFGNNSIVLEYQDINTLNYQDTWFDLNISLAVNLSGEFDSTVNNISVFTREDGYKFQGFFKSVNLGDLPFQYTVNADREIKKGNRFDYYISQTNIVNCGSVKCTNEEIHEFDFKDICEIKYNETDITFDPLCSFDLNETNLEITFLAEYNSSLAGYFIDPEISIEDVSSAVSILTNITAENNFTHLTVNNPNLIFYAPFDTNTSTTKIYDYTSENNDGDYVDNAVYTESGYIGGGLELDGSGDWVQVAGLNDVLSGSTGFTVMTWVKFDVGTDSGTFMGQHRSGFGQWKLYKLNCCGGQNRWYFQMRNSTGSEPTTNFKNMPATTEWVHIAGVFNGTDEILYIDGVEEIKASLFGSLISQTYDLCIGRVGAGCNEAVDEFGGKLDEMMIFNVSLTASEILDIFNNQSSLKFPSTGTQEFRDNNITSGDTLNITINSSQFFNSNITVSVGDVSGSGYSFGTPVGFVNNLASDISVGTITNFSLLFTSHAGNDSSNPFISPNLINNINITSFDAAPTGTAFGANVTQLLSSTLNTAKRQDNFRLNFQSFSISSFINKLYSGFRTISQQFSFVSIAEKLKSQFNSISQELSPTSFINKILGQTTEVSQSFTITSFVNRLYSSFRDISQDFSITSLADKVQNRFKSILQAFSITSIVDILKTAGTGATAFVENILQSFSLNSSIERLYSSFRDIIQSFTITSIADTVQGRFRTLIQAFSFNSSADATFITRIVKSITQAFSFDSAITKLSTFSRSIFQSILAIFGLVPAADEAIVVAGGGGSKFDAGDNQTLLDMRLAQKEDWYFGFRNSILVDTLFNNSVNTDIEQLESLSETPGISYQHITIHRLDTGFYRIVFEVNSLGSDTSKNITVKVNAMKNTKFISREITVQITEPSFLKKLVLIPRDFIDGFRDSLVDDKPNILFNVIMILFACIVLILFIVLFLFTALKVNERKNK